MNDKLKKLHEILVSKGIDNKSFNDFKDNFSNSIDKQKKLHALLVDRGIDNKDFREFQSNFFSINEEQEVKKKEESDSFAQEQAVESPTSSAPTITLSEEELQEEQPAGDSINKERANYFRNKERLNLLREDYVIGSPEYEEEINKRVSSSLKEREGIGVDLDKSIKSAASGLAEIPNFMMEQLFTAFMDEDELEKLNKLDYEDRRDLIADLTAKGVQNLPDAVKLSNPLITKFLKNDGLRKSNEISDEIRGELDYLEKISKDYDTSIGEDIISLDVGQASERIVGGVVQSVAPMMQSMIPYVGLASVGLASASSKSRDLQESGENLGLATSANAILSGTVEAVTEKISAGLGKKFLKSFDLSPEKTVIVLKEVVGKFLKDFNLEGLSESAVEVSNMLLDSLVSGKEDAFLEGWSRIIDSYIIGGAMGGTLSTGGAIPKQIKQITESNRTYKDLEASKYSTLPEMFTSESDIDVDKLSIAGKTYSRKFLERDLKKMVSKGEISESEMKVRMNTFDEIKGYFHETDDLDLTNEQRAQAANLIKEKIALERQIEGKDKSLSSKKIKRINEINENLSNISDIDTEVDEAVTTETVSEEVESTETQDIIYAKRDIGDGETAILKIEDGQKTVVGESQVPEGTNIIEESEADAQLETAQEQEVSQETKKDTLDTNKGESTQGFFSDVVQGKSEKYKPSKEYEYELEFDEKQEGFRESYDKKKGNFDEHIATSIPTFRDTQVKKGSAIVETYKNQEGGATVIDIGGSEGSWVKTITEQSGGSIKTINVDPNPEMKEAFDKGKPEESEMKLEAFYEGWDGVKAYKPEDKADVVHESMTFQFIKKDRKNYIKEVKDSYLKDDGVFITEEKFKGENYELNELIKNRKHKSKYFTDEQQRLKGDEVLTGMRENQAEFNQYLEELNEQFDYVEVYWKSGNFVGIMASNNKARINQLKQYIGDTGFNYNAESQIQNQLEDHKANGGSTFSVSEGNLSGKEGYSVSVFPDLSETVNGNNVTFEQLQAFYNKHKDKLGGNLAVGTWYSEKNDKTYIDIVGVVKDKQKAIDLGKKYNQEAIFDLKSMEEVDTKGTGETIKNLPSLEERINELNETNEQNQQESDATESTIAQETEGLTATQEEETETNLEPNQEGGTVDIVDKDRVYANIDDIIQKTNSRQSGVVEKSELQENKLNNSINYLQKTKWYQQASDIQRESSVRDVYEKLGEKQPKNVSVNRILAKKSKKISVDEKAALKSQIRLEARAARDKKLDVDRTRKSLMSKISTVLKEGKINNKVFNSVQKRINSVNLDNPIMTERLIDYVDKVFSKAENVEKISQANKLRAKAKKGNKSIDVNINEAAKDFAKINPLMVSDIDAYIDVAKKVVDGLNRKGVVLSKVYEYVDPVLESQRQKSRKEIVNSFEEDTGTEGMTYDEVMQIINTQEEGGSVDTEKLRIARDKLTSQYNSMQAIVKSMYKNKKDPFTGENVSFSKKQVELMSLFSDSDPSTLPNKTLSDVVFGMSNMITNQTYGGLESILSNIQGNQSMRTFKGKSRDLRFLWSKSFGRAKGGYLTSIPVLTEQMFASKQLAQNFLNKTFFNKVKQDANKEKARSYKKIKSYLKKFNNVDGFHDSKNIFERGTFAFMFRIDSRIDDDSSVREDFLRKKNLLKENYNALLKSKDSDDVRKGEGYKEAYDKILGDSNNVSDIKSKMSEYNLKAVESWIEDFKERYGDYRDVSESVYNKILNKENNYTPISYKEMLGSNKEIKEAEANLTDYLYQKMSGNLMKSKKNASLPKKTVGSRVITTHYIDLDFDTNMANSFVRTNIDVGTASSIQKLKGAMDSESFVDAFNNDEDAELMRKIINTYVRDKRGSSYIDDREMKRLVSTIDSLAKIGASTTLAGVFQPIKQIVPAAANTFINAGRLDIQEYHLNYKAINKLLEETGQDIANRGIESISSLDIADSRISSDVGKMKKTVNYVTDKWIKTFIANPDSYVARVSWLSYYNQAYRKKYGVENSNIDWSNHQLDQEIADYANNMVNRNQNTSDADLQGMFLKDRNSMSSLIRKTLMPFANFAINQKMRLHADAVILVNKNASTQEKKQAARSFAATMTEATVFHGIGGAITYYMYSAVAAMLGYDEKDEDKDKRLKNIIKGRASYFVPDMLSPLPLLDTPVLTLSNKLLRAVQSDEELSDYEKSLGFEEEEPFVLYDGSFPNQSILDDYGMYGIYLTKLTQTYDLASGAITGEYSKEYYGKKFTSEYDPSSQESLSYLTMISTLYNLGFLPSEAGQVVRYGEKILQKKSKESNKK